MAIPGRYSALLFDMDAILSSIPAVERAWTAWALRAGVSPQPVLDYLHGRPAVDTIRHFLPAHLSLTEEVAWLDARELDDLDGIAPIPGAEALLRSLPPNAWAVVTSANRALALRRIAAAGLPQPAVMITSDDVTHGKPHPEGYLAAANLLSVSPADCLVLEDSDTGLAAGRACGAQVLRLSGNALGAKDTTAQDISDYRHIRVRVTAGRLNISQAPVEHLEESAPP